MTAAMPCANWASIARRAACWRKCAAWSFGGTFSVKFAELSGAMARSKIEAIVRTGAKTVVSLDPSCLMQIQGALSRAGIGIRTMHLAEVLASR